MYALNKIIIDHLDQSGFGKVAKLFREELVTKEQTGHREHVPAALLQ